MKTKAEKRATAMRQVLGRIAHYEGQRQKWAAVMGDRERTWPERNNAEALHRTACAAKLTAEQERENLVAKGVQP